MILDVLGLALKAIDLNIYKNIVLLIIFCYTRALIREFNIAVDVSEFFILVLFVKRFISTLNRFNVCNEHANGREYEHTSSKLGAYRRLSFGICTITCTLDVFKVAPSVVTESRSRNGFISYLLNIIPILFILMYG